MSSRKFSLSWLALLLVPLPGLAQGDRFQRFEPGLILETDGRVGACDVITFTPDGQFVLASGDDKVVRIWKYANQALDPHPVHILRWSIFREQRGNMYALAVSPDARAKHVAAGGLGVRVGAASVAIFDRASGEMLKSLVDPDPGVSVFAVWSIAFSPSGKRIAYGQGDGTASVWEWEKASPGDIIRLGKHVGTGNGVSNKIRGVMFRKEDELVSVAEDGEMLQWNVAKPSEKPRQLHRFDMAAVWQTRFSADRQWVGVASQRDKERVQAYSFADQKVVKFPLDGNDRATSLNFDHAGQQLAVGIWSDVGAERVGKIETRGKVRIFDLRNPAAKARDATHPTYQIDALAFHPSGKQLVLAGGDNHEVTLWDIAKSTQPLTTIQSPGSCLYGVALSNDKESRYLAFQDKRAVDASDPNHMGAGPWRIFDLQRRSFAPPGTKYTPVKPLETLDGWSVKRTGDARVWKLVGPKGEVDLPWDYNRDGPPRCYTFLKGKTPRLAVGHFWGVSIFEFNGKDWQRSRLMVGQQGEVMALGTSEDQMLLVTASRDQTIAAWSLAEWPNHPELGASFLLRGGKLFVQEVALGSPAWEAGLSKNDEITLFAYKGKLVYGPDPKTKQMTGTPELAATQLRNPEPGAEMVFYLKRTGEKAELQKLTTMRQRPLWRFFPTRNDEWVLWRWRDYYYASSTNGDSYIGWLVSGDAKDKPTFYRAEQFRQKFYRPDKVAAMIAGQQEPEKVSVPDIEPPDVRLAVNSEEIKGKDLVVTINVKARGEQPNQRLKQILLWINDFQFKSFPAEGSAFQQQITIPRDQLRRGLNVLTLQCYNQADVRGEAPAVVVDYQEPALAPRLFGLFVGIGDYAKAKRRISDLNADKDADAMHKAWLGQEKKLYAKVDLQLLTNEAARPEEVLKQLRKVATEAKPDDVFVLFLGGHGTSAEELEGIVKKAKQPPVNKLPPLSFAFVGPEFDPFKPNDTCVTSKDLYEAIANLPCRKLILLDTCHSGTFSVNPVRELTRDGVGPVIITACQPEEQAIEFGLLDSNQAYGLFTMAVRRALGEEFTKADANEDKVLDASELAEFIKKRVPELVTRLKALNVGLDEKDTQRPADFLPRMEQKVPVAKQ